MVEIEELHFSAHFVRDISDVGIQTVFHAEIRVERISEIHLAVFEGGIFTDVQILDRKHVHVIKGFHILGETFVADEFFQKIIYAVDRAARSFARDHDILSPCADDESVIGKIADVCLHTAHVRADMNFGRSSGTALHVGKIGNDGARRLIEILVKCRRRVHFGTVGHTARGDVVKAFSVFGNNSSHIDLRSAAGRRK